MNRLKSISIFLLLFFITTTQCLAQDITLSWDASPSTSVTGYYVYYQNGSSDFSSGCTDAYEGASPIDVENSLTITLTDLEDDATYYFAVTAYDASGNESTYSNIVSNDTSADTTTASTESNVPVLIFPENNKTDEPVITSFEWDEMDSSYNVRYELVYGTDLDKVTAAGHIPSLPTNPIVPASPLLLLALVSIGLLYRNKTSQKAVRWILLSLLSITLISACGGGGGSSSSSTSKSVSSTTDEAILVITDTGDNPYCDVGPLEYSTTYYWKVVAFDKSDSTVFYESEIYQFTTVSD